MSKPRPAKPNAERSPNPAARPRRSAVSERDLAHEAAAIERWAREGGVGPDRVVEVVSVREVPKPIADGLRRLTKRTPDGTKHALFLVAPHPDGSRATTILRLTDVGAFLAAGAGELPEDGGEAR